MNSTDILSIMFNYFDFVDLQNFRMAFCSLLDKSTVKDLLVLHKRCIKDLAFWMGTVKVNEFNCIYFRTPMAFATFTRYLSWHGYTGYIPSGLRLFANLEYLRLENVYNGQYNVVTDLPKELCYLPRLLTLELNGIKCKTLPAVSAASTVRLEKLIIDSNPSLTHLPEWLIGSRLKNLVIRYCPHLTNIPIKLLENLMDRSSAAFEAYSSYLEFDVVDTEIIIDDRDMFCFEHLGLLLSTHTTVQDLHSWVQNEAVFNRDHNILTVTGCVQLKQFLVNQMDDLPLLKVLHDLRFFP